MMKALVKFAAGPGNAALRDVPEPIPGPGQVKVEVQAAGVCGSDLHIYHDDIQIPVEPPVIMGHEFSGNVVERGEEVERVQVGDRVTCETSATFCGRCLHCRIGNYNMCSQRKVVGYAVDGCFARYIVVNERQVHALPDNVDFISGALTEPLACCVHAVLEQTPISPGDLVVITGPGTIGLLCLQLVKAAGGVPVVCGTSQDAERLRLARQMGAAKVMDVTTEDLLAWLDVHAPFGGADVFLECAGAPAAARLGLQALRRGGRYTQIGLFSGPFELAFDLIAYKELLVTGTLGQRWSSWRRTLSLMQQAQVQPRPLISHVLPLSQWREAFRLVEEKQGLKVILEPES